MKVTLGKGLHVSIEDMQPCEWQALINMIRGAGLEERRIVHGVLTALPVTPSDKLERSAEA